MILSYKECSLDFPSTWKYMECELDMMTMWEVGLSAKEMDISTSPYSGYRPTNLSTISAIRLSAIPAITAFAIQPSPSELSAFRHRHPALSIPALAIPAKGHPSSRNPSCWHPICSPLGHFRLTAIWLSRHVLTLAHSPLQWIRESNLGRRQYPLKVYTWNLKRLGSDLSSLGGFDFLCSYTWGLLVWESRIQLESS
jgi:hypothetical protein